jgi:hypothetical protein
MANNPGWGDVEEYINNNIKSLENRLFDDDLTKEEFDVVQAERRAYKSVLNFVNKRVNAIPLEN